MAESQPTVLVDRQDDIYIVTLNRPEVKNAVDSHTAKLLAEAFLTFEQDDTLNVAVFSGEHGTFCAGADLKAVSAGSASLENFPELDTTLDALDQRGPMGPSYMQLSKPVIGAISGYAVAGGLELSLWCDMRVVEEDAVFGVFCRRWGVPLVDGGTVRLPRLIGHSNAMDMILTGRAVDAGEAKIMGLANRVVATGTAKDEAIALARQISKFPQHCMRNDRQSACEQWGLSFEDAMSNENRLGREVLLSGETLTGATRFASGHGRGGSFEDI
ncbi:MAG: crotonase/enoyl-CoA hydratase family protein [Halioglobus sp.]